MKAYVEKVSNSPTHYKYLPEVPSEISDYLETNRILTFTDINNPINLQSIEIKYEVTHPENGNPSQEEQEVHTSTVIEKFITNTKKSLNFVSYSVNHYGYFSSGEDQACLSNIVLKFNPGQNFDQTRGFLSSQNSVVKINVSNHSSYTISIYDPRDDLSKVKHDIMEDMDFVRSVDKYSHY